MPQFRSATMIVNAQSRRGQELFEQACKHLSGLPFAADARAVEDPAELEPTLKRALAAKPDLVILDADPTQDIRNSEKIDRVMLNGRLYEAEDQVALQIVLDATASMTFHDKYRTAARVSGALAYLGRHRRLDGRGLGHRWRGDHDGPVVIGAPGWPAD